MSDDSRNPLSDPIFRRISRLADAMGVRAYVVGGYVRDYYLGRPSTDIDVVVVGAGSPWPKRWPPNCIRVCRSSRPSARRCCAPEVWKSSSSAHARSPIRPIRASPPWRRGRSKTTSSAAISRSTRWRGRSTATPSASWSIRSRGLRDLRERIIRTPCDADVTFSDDPLRMMRAVRFAAQLGFDILPETFAAIRRNRERIRIVSRERIAVELNKIVASAVPSRGFDLLERSGLLALIFPEMQALKGVERVGRHAHKDNFYHTLKVLDNVAAKRRRPLAALGGRAARHRQAAHQGLRSADGVDVPFARDAGVEDGAADLPPYEAADERTHEVRAEDGLPPPAANHPVGGSGDRFGRAAAALRGGRRHRS